MRPRAISQRLAATLLACVAAFARAEPPIEVLERETLRIEHRAPTATHELRLTFAYLEGTGWTRDDLVPLASQSARILEQCDVALVAVELVRIDAPAPFRDYATGPARRLARALPLARPTVYFVADTRQRPAFDAEAIGRSNSRSRPELTDTVWLARATRDPGVALAHELAHVLMDSGKHSEEEGNLMRDETSPQNLRLSTEQCARLRDVGTSNGLIR